MARMRLQLKEAKLLRIVSYGVAQNCSLNRLPVHDPLASDAKAFILPILVIP